MDGQPTDGVDEHLRTPPEGDVLDFGGLPAGTPAAQPRRGRRLLGHVATALVAVSAALVAAAGVTVAASGALSSGSGTMPVQILPADTLAVTWLNFNPSLSEKLAVQDLAGKFPALTRQLPSPFLAGRESLKDEIVSQFFAGHPDGLTYNADIKPWLGDRVAVAVVPGPGGVPALVGLLQYSSLGSLKSHLSSLLSQGGDSYVLSHGYILIARSQAEANAVSTDLAAGGALSDSPAYQAVEAHLPAGQLAGAYVSLRALASVLPGGGSLPGLGQLRGDAIGAALHATGSELLLDVVEHGGDSGAPLPAQTLLSDLPADADAALDFSGVGTTLSRAVTGLAQFGTDLGPLARLAGASTPPSAAQLRRLASVLGSEDALVVTVRNGEPLVALRVRTATAAHAESTLRTTLPELALRVPPLAGLASQLQIRTVRGGFLVGSPALVSQLARSAPGRSLLAGSAFRQAVPDAGRATLVLYVDVHALLDSLRDVPASVTAELAHLGSVGLQVTEGSDPSVQLRLTTVG